MSLSLHLGHVQLHKSLWRGNTLTHLLWDVKYILCVFKQTPCTSCRWKASSYSCSHRFSCSDLTKSSGGKCQPQVTANFWVVARDSLIDGSHSQLLWESQPRIQVRAHRWTWLPASTALARVSNLILKHFMIAAKSILFTCRMFSLSLHYVRKWNFIHTLSFAFTRRRGSLTFLWPSPICPCIVHYFPFLGPTSHIQELLTAAKDIVAVALS